MKDSKVKGRDHLGASKGKKTSIARTSSDQVAGEIGEESEHAVDTTANNNVKNNELENKIETMCREMGIPDPNELYVIPRDYETSGNPNLTQYSMTMPEGLTRWVDEEEFEYTMGQLNSHFARAEQIDCRTVWNAVCKFLTCFTIQACQRTRMERAIIRVRNFILHQNRNIYHPKGFHLVEPAARGLRHVEFRSITFYSMKYFLEHEDEIEVSDSEIQNLGHHHHHKHQDPFAPSKPRRSVFSHFQYQSMDADALQSE